MSSKVRMVFFNSRVGKWYVGSHVLVVLNDEAYRVGTKLPMVTQKEPAWKRVVWMFDHVKTEGSKLYIWRELRRTPAWRSPYVQLAGRQLGKVGPKFTVAQMLAWEQGRRRRDRERQARQLADVVRRNRQAGQRDRVGGEVPQPMAAPGVRRVAFRPVLGNVQVQAQAGNGLGGGGGQLDWLNVANAFGVGRDNVLIPNAPQRFRLNMNRVPEEVVDEVEQRAQRDREEGL